MATASRLSQGCRPTPTAGRFVPCAIRPWLARAPAGTGPSAWPARLLGTRRAHGLGRARREPAARLRGPRGSRGRAVCAMPSGQTRQAPASRSARRRETDRDRRVRFSAGRAADRVAGRWLGRTRRLLREAARGRARPGTHASTPARPERGRSSTPRRLSAPTVGENRGPIASRKRGGCRSLRAATARSGLAPSGARLRRAGAGRRLSRREVRPEPNRGGPFRRDIDRSAANGSGPRRATARAIRDPGHAAGAHSP